MISSHTNILSSSQEIELIIGNSNPNFSGVTSTMLQVLSEQSKLINLRVMGKHHLSDKSLNISFWNVVKMCRKPLNDGRFRVFHARRIDEMIQALLLKYIFGAKIKIIFSSAAQRKRAGFTKWLTDQMDAVLAMCNASASYLHKAPDAIIYHGVKTDMYTPPINKQDAWRSLNLLPKTAQQGKYGIAILGRVRKQKGVHLFVESCIQVLEKYPDYTAVVVGAIRSGDEALVTSLKEKISKAGLSHRIIFVGEQNFSDIPNIFRSLSMVVALSDNEGFGLTILEAMSSGAAVLASEAGAWPEVVEEGKQGYVVPINNLPAVVEKMDLLLSEPEKLKKMGMAGRERILEHYSVEREANELIAFYRTMM